VNHNGSVDLALRLVDAAVAAGADAVKFQTFRADRLATLHAPKATYQTETTGEFESQFDMLRKLELDERAHRTLLVHCASRGIVFLSTPFDEESADFLETLDVPAYKLPSGELTNLPFLRHVARKKRPMIISTGMATLEEVGRAVEAVRIAECKELALLHCVSAYPADPADVNLRAMATLAEAFGVPVGYSDHTLGNEVAFAAVAMGACILEKHFTLNRSLPGPDHRISAEPADLAALVVGARKVEAALGNGGKCPAASETDTVRIARKSLVAACDVPAGTVLGMEHVVARRPGTGIPLGMRDRLVGRKTKVTIPAGTLFDWGMIE
jgi:N-acetylneuraminate synthase/N,N'-diacetyllegionaminate synthase